MGLIDQVKCMQEYGLHSNIKCLVSNLSRATAARTEKGTQPERMSENVLLLSIDWPNFFGKNPKPGVDPFFSVIGWDASQLSFASPLPSTKKIIVMESLQTVQMENTVSSM